MTPDALHGLTHHPLTLVAVLCLAAAGPVLGWVLAMGLVGPRARAGRAARAVGLAVWVLLPAALCIRLAAILAGGAGLTPLLAPLGVPAGGWHPHDAIVLFALPLAALQLVFIELMALFERSRPPRALSVPLALPVAALCIGAALLGTLAGVWSLQQTLTELVGAEVFALAPLVLVSFAIWTQSFDAVPAEATEASTEDPATTEHVDIPKRWQKVGALLEGARSFVKQNGNLDTTASAGQAAWNTVGGADACPELLDALATAGIPVGEAWQVGDLPAPTEALLVTAATHLALRTHHQQVLVICQDPEASAALLHQADTVAGGHWPVGPTVVGLAGLRQALADGSLPAVAFLTIEDLSAGGIRALDAGSRGALWARTLGLIVLEGFDRGGPLALTHRIHTLRRLRLVLDQRGVRCGVLLTSNRSRAVRTLVQQAFGGIQVQDVPLRPRSTRALTVWLADYHFVLRSPAGWVKQAAEPVAKAGHRVRVSDPSGSFDDASIQVWQGNVRRTPQFTLEGEASIGLLDAPMLIAAWRSLPHRVSASEDRGRHHALWSLIDEPVTRYLLGEDRLARLQASDELPAPAAVAALDNRLVARGHVRAALHEAVQERAALAAAFGASLVDELLAEHAGSTAFAVRSTGNGVVRTPRLKRNAEDPGDPLGAVGQTAQIVDRETGQVLRTVDALTAPTRYYPRRVFSHGGRRYAVPAAGEPSRRIEVDPVAPDVALTTARLKIEVTSRKITEAEQRHTRGRFSYRAAVHDLLAVETVSGALGSDGASVEYEPVQARYLTSARVIGFPGAPGAVALSHLAASFGDTLRALLLLGNDDLLAVPVPAGWGDGAGPGIVVVERSVQGLGIAAVLDEARVARGFDWVHAMLSACSCPRGCANCTPAWQVATGELDKPGVLRLLTGT